MTADGKNRNQTKGEKENLFKQPVSRDRKLVYIFQSIKRTVLQVKFKKKLLKKIETLSFNMNPNVLFLFSFKYCIFCIIIICHFCQINCF